MVAGLLVAVLLLLCIHASSFLTRSSYLGAARAGTARRRRPSALLQQAVPVLPSLATAVTEGEGEAAPRPSIWSNNLIQRSATGLVLAGLGSAWMCSGPRVFALGYLAASFIAQREFHAMAEAAGLQPVLPVSLLTSLLCCLAPPRYSEVVLPLCTSLLMMWMLARRQAVRMSDMGASLLGMVYVGALPSYWLRLRGTPEGVRLAWWTCACVAAADMGGYFVGRAVGRRPLSRYSPKKTIEGLAGGLAACTSSAVLAAYAMGWPRWPITGAAYGLLLGTTSVVGDLAASSLKRDAQLKDTGALLPGHGGLLDRIDSHVLAAPLAFHFVRDLLPALAPRP